MNVTGEEFITEVLAGLERFTATGTYVVRLFTVKVKFASPQSVSLELVELTQ